MDNKYFKTQKKGELFELKQDLNSDKKDKKKEAVKRIIAHMTVGKDMSELFTDVLNCMQTDNLELKKLVYLYLMHYAKSHPDMAILAVNSFVKDCDDSNPLIRALAVRTMGCIRVSNISEYLCEPLRKCLKDEDPYVRKTAAVCVVKLYAINPELVEEQGFLDTLRDLLTDANPMVIANSVAALAEIAFHSDCASKYFELNHTTVNKLLTALNECTEWGQIFILDSLIFYNPTDVHQAQSICERITSRLSHSNAALVLSTVKLLLKFLDFLPTDSPFIGQICKKMAPPLITLLSGEPEIQYVALRNIDLITQKRPEILQNEAKSFFIKYNDPIYVKLEKLGIIIKLANESNIQQVLAELKEYASEVDVDFIRRSVRAIGRCALKVESSSDKCVNTLLDLIQTKVTYVVQESIVVMRDILRRFPNRYESVIEKLCENLDQLDEPEARGALIWIIGEYAERIDNASEILQSFLSGFFDESAQVQLQILTAIVKLFIKRSAENQELVQRVLTMVTQECDNPDIRDRGYIYWRLLSTDPVSARDVVLAPKPLISPEADNLEPSLLEELILNISTLASVYHKPPSSFIEGHAQWRKGPIIRSETLPALVEDDVAPVLLDEDLARGSTNVQQQQRASATPAVVSSLIDDLLELSFDPVTPFSNNNGSSAPVPPTTQLPPGYVQNLIPDVFSGLDPIKGGISSHPDVTQSSTQNTIDIIAFNPFPVDSKQQEQTLSFAAQAGSSFYTPPLTTWLSASKGKGLDVSGTFICFGFSSIHARVHLTNNALAPMSGFAIQFNGNYFGLAMAPLPVSFPPVLASKQSHDLNIVMNFQGNILKTSPIDTIQVAIKNNVDIFYFTCHFPMNYFYLEGTEAKITEQQFIETWTSMPEFPGCSCVLSRTTLTREYIKSTLTSNRMFCFELQAPATICCRCVLRNQSWALGQLILEASSNRWKLLVKANHQELSTAVFSNIQAILDWSA